MRSVEEIEAEAERLGKNPAKAISQPGAILDLVLDTLGHVRQLREDLEEVRGDDGREGLADLDGHLGGTE